MNFDLVIVGGGLAGAALAAALRGSALKIALVEAQASTRPAGWDARIYAISPANAAFLGTLGVWRHLDAARLTPVRRMEIFGDRQGHLAFSAYDAGLSELAWILESSLMQDELWQTVKRQPNVTLFCPDAPARLERHASHACLALQSGRELHAPLVVAADGARSWVREQAGLAADTQSYGEMGVVANFQAEKAHCDTAWQWFRADGVLAWLPLPDRRISMVWSTPDAHATELMALTPEALCERVAQAGGHHLGALAPVTPAAAFPLRLMRVPRTIAPRVALIGDAAHAIHPLSGHGINLGYQDAAVLARVLAEAPQGADLGDERLLRRYERSRREEVAALQWTTHGLQRLFRPQAAPLALLRNAGLNLTNSLPFVRSMLARYATLGPAL